MRRLAQASLFLCLFAAAGCGQNLDGISSAADSARNASEEFANNADIENHRREAKVIADAELMSERIKAQNGAPDGSRPRYELHKDNVGDSWTVYDTANGRAIRVDSKTQSGLSHDEAEATLAKLMQSAKQQDELFGRGRP